MSEDASANHCLSDLTVERLGRVNGESAVLRSPSMATHKVVWKKHPEKKDFEGASRYLGLIVAAAESKRIVEALRRTPVIAFAAKDLLRASALPLLPKDDAEVDSDLKRIRKGKPLPPVLLVRGDAAAGVPLCIADGYHRVCAICYFDEKEPVHCCLASF